MDTSSLELYLKERFLFLLSSFADEDMEYFYTHVFKIRFGLFVQEEFVERFVDYLFVNLLKKYPSEGISKVRISEALGSVLGSLYCLHHHGYEGKFSVMPGYLLNNLDLDSSLSKYEKWISQKPFTFLGWLIVPAVCFISPDYFSFEDSEIVLYPAGQNRIMAEVSVNGERLMLTKHAFLRFMTRGEAYDFSPEISEFNITRNAGRLMLMVETMQEARQANYSGAVAALIRNNYEPVEYHKTNKWVFVVNEKGFVKTCFPLNLTNEFQYRYK
jgi:hypothetical protein